MMIPTVIVAIGVYAVFLRWHLVGTTTGFVLAYICLALPFVFVTVRSRLQTFDLQLYENAAASLGAHPLRTFTSVTMRLIAPSIVAAALLTFVVSFDEVVVGLFLVDPTISTLPVQMLHSVVQEPDPTIAAASTLIFGVTLILLAGLMWARSRRGHA
jgi:putative spermidine/putrescine transport system permease protein